MYTMAPVFSLVLDRDVTDVMALVYPELYRELLKVRRTGHTWAGRGWPVCLTCGAVALCVLIFRQGRALSLKSFFIWVLISVYQGRRLSLAAGRWRRLPLPSSAA